MAFTSKRISSSINMDISRLSTSWILMALLVAAVSICTANAVASSTVASLDQKSTVSPGTSTQSAPATPHQLAGHTKDDIYIDDDASEGSGGHGGNREDLDREPDYSGSGLGPDDEDSVTHSRNNNNNFNNKYPNKHNQNTGAPGSGKNSNNNNNNEGFDGSGDGGFTDIRGENDDDEDNRFGHTNVKLPTGSTNSQTPTTPVHKSTDEDLHIEEEDKHNEEDEDLDGDEDEDDEDEDMDPDSTKDHDDDHIGGGMGGVGEDDLGKDLHHHHHNEKPAVDPTTTDDEDLEPGTKDEDEEDTSNRGLNTYPEEKDRQNVGAGGAATGTGSSGVVGNEVHIMNAKNEDRTTSFFSQPGILAAVIGGAVVGLLCAILVVMFIVYRMRKKDEGSYALDEPKRSPAANSYAKNTNNREFYA